MAKLAIAVRLTRSSRRTLALALGQTSTQHGHSSVPEDALSDGLLEVCSVVSRVESGQPPERARQTNVETIMNRAAIAVGSIVGLVSLAGCTTGAKSSPSSSASTASVTSQSSSNSSSQSKQSGDGLAKALGQISAKAKGPYWSIEYGRSKALAALAQQYPKQWAATGGIGLAGSPTQFDTLGLNVQDADFSVTVGIDVAQVRLISGGQDAATIAKTAKGLGYAGSDVLTKDLDVSIPVTTTVNKVKATSADVVLAGQKADIGWVDGSGDSVLDREAIAGIVGCLGDLKAAAIAQQTQGILVGVGLTDDGSKVRTVICKPGGESQQKQILNALATGKTGTGTAYADKFGTPESKIVDGVVQVTTLNSATAPATTIYQMFQTQELPGV